jgi:hypothetical protein
MTLHTPRHPATFSARLFILRGLPDVCHFRYTAFLSPVAGPTYAIALLMALSQSQSPPVDQSLN